MPRGFRVGDPRAVAAGRKGGRSPKRLKHRRTFEYTRGYVAGWIAGKRHAIAAGRDE